MDSKKAFLLATNVHGYAKSLNLDIADVLTRLIMSAYESFKNDVEVEHEFQ